MSATLLSTNAARREDLALITEIAESLDGLERHKPTMQLGIVNRAGFIYREITVHGPTQYRAVRDCFTRHGYRLRPGDAHLIAHFQRVSDDSYEPSVGAWDEE
jgi:hypothetical protein